MQFDYYYRNEADQFSFVRLPKQLFTDPKFRTLSSDAKILYGLMLDRMSLSRKNMWFDDLGRVYIVYTIANVQEDLCCASGKAVKMVKELSDIGLIEKKRQGQGKATLIYVKDFTALLNCENQNSENQNFEEENPRIAKIEIQELAESKSNNTESTETELTRQKDDELRTALLINDDNVEWYEGYLRKMKEHTDLVDAAARPYMRIAETYFSDEPAAAALDVLLRAIGSLSKRSRAALSDQTISRVFTMIPEILETASIVDPQSYVLAILKDQVKKKS